MSGLGQDRYEFEFRWQNTRTDLQGRGDGNLRRRQSFGRTVGEVMGDARAKAKPSGQQAGSAPMHVTAPWLATESYCYIDCGAMRGPGKGG